jgi:hypothetical protein
VIVSRLYLVPSIVLSKNILSLFQRSLCLRLYTGDGQNNGNSKKLRNIICIGYIERTSLGNTECSSVCLHSVAIVLSDSPCERIGKWETRPILQEDRSLVRV